MKKKLTAVLLTLCMVVGLLPMSALAAWYKDDVKTDVPDTAAKGDKITVDGTEYYVFDVIAEDTLTYYSNSDGTGTKGTLTWKADEATEVVVEVDAGEPDADGVASVEVNSSDIDVAISGNDNVDDITAATAVTINVTVAENATGLKVTLNEQAAAKLVSAEAPVSIAADGVGSVELPATVVAGLTGAVELTLNTSAALPSSLPETSDAATKLPETAPIVDVTLNVGGKPQTAFTAAVTVSVKVDLAPSAEDPILVYYIDDAGKVTPEHSITALVNGLLQWNTKHFSTWTYMTKTEAEAAGLETVIPDPDNPDTPDINVTAFPTVAEDGLGKVYSFTARAADTVLYQVVGTDGAVKSLVLTSGGSAYKVSAKTGEHVLAYVGTNIQPSTDKDFFTYDAISAAYDSAK